MSSSSSFSSYPLPVHIFFPFLFLLPIFFLLLNRLVLVLTLTALVVFLLFFCSKYCHHESSTCRCADGCGGNITNTEAIISSPHFPETYYNDEHCVWHFAPPVASTDQIKVKFLNFSVEDDVFCGYDSVTIFDNLANSIELIGR